MELDDLTDTIVDTIPNANRSNVYRTLKAFDINRVPKEQKEKALVLALSLRKNLKSMSLVIYIFSRLRLGISFHYMM
jgi:hypothetical protein